ncbi:hypothetical protein C8R45DRAFT_1089427 [Mycena sanguinolenta]|nr:hypothetical protein C8R45DRAFT_1089427 [Mycena sanguinolenta]
MSSSPVWTSARGTYHHDNHVVLRRIEFEKPMVYDEDVERTFTVSSRSAMTSEEPVHGHGEFKCRSTLRTTMKFVQMLILITRHMAVVVQGSPFRYTWCTMPSFPAMLRLTMSPAFDASGMEAALRSSCPVTTTAPTSSSNPSAPSCTPRAARRCSMLCIYACRLSP